MFYHCMVISLRRVIKWRHNMLITNQTAATFIKEVCTKEHADDSNNKKNKPLTIRGIPLIAIVFPPLGLLMLLKYLLNKNKKEE